MDARRDDPDGAEGRGGVVITLERRDDGWRARAEVATSVIVSHRPAPSAREALAMVGVDIEEPWATELTAAAEREQVASDDALTAAAFIAELRAAGLHVD